jgi:hypothetical protein
VTKGAQPALYNQPTLEKLSCAALCKVVALLLKLCLAVLPSP